MSVTLNGIKSKTDFIVDEHTQYTKLSDGRTGGTENIAGTTKDGLYVDPHGSVSSVSNASVNCSTASQTLKAANSARRKLCVTNTSATQWAFVRCGATASLTAFDAPIAPGYGHWEMPFVYDGIMSIIWAGADAAGKAIVSEYA